MSSIQNSPSFGFLRLRHILGDKNTPPIIPVSKSKWWAGVKSGEYPKPVRLSNRVTAWRTKDIQELADRLAEQG